MSGERRGGTQTKGGGGHASRGASVRLRTRRFIYALLLAGLLPCAASAYTIIMRNGRRVEAPARFVVTQTTLTYEAARGLNVTLQLSQIDIAATERANGEPPGSLLRRAAAHDTNAPASSPRVARTLTNRELEPARRARLESERAYEQRRKELGLPSPEEERRSAEAEAETLHRIASQHEAEQAQAESYWRARAAALRAEAAALDAEMEYLRTRLGVAPDYFTPGYGALITTFGPHFARRPFPFAAPPGSVNVTGVGTSTQAGGSLTVGGGTTRGHIFFNQQSTTGTLRGHVTGTPGLLAPPFILLEVPFNYATADTIALRVRFLELEAARAGLDARWQQLEDEARRAGALPGWLRE